MLQLVKDEDVRRIARVFAEELVRSIHNTDTISIVVQEVLRALVKEEKHRANVIPLPENKGVMIG